MAAPIDKKTAFKGSNRDEVKSQRMGDMLRKDGQITKFQLDEALAYQKKNKMRLGQILVGLGFIDEETMIGFISRQLQIPKISLTTYQISDELINLVPPEMAKEHFVIPVELANGTLTVATSDPTNLKIQEELSVKTKQAIKLCVTTDTEIGAALVKYYKISEKEHKELFHIVGSGEEDKEELQSVDDLGALLSDVIDDVEVEDANEVEDMSGGPSANDAPIIKLVNEILIKAIRTGVSDIHIEPFEKVFYVRYRKDGSLYKSMNLPMQIKPAIISRIKIMANLNIAERRVPQDGRIKMRIGKNKSIDFRVSSLPTLWGESIVLRILNPDSLMLDFTKLGFSQDALEKFNRAIEQPQGMVIITGPTGSGKTNTLYSAINKLNDPSVKILTAEDPIEFNFPGINQVLVRNEVGMTYSAALKAFLRQDPEIILVGETRDMETAEICIKAAMTGHLVFTTLHTNDCPSTVGRLIDIGIPSYMVASALNLILGQRLLKRICSKCRTPVENLDNEKLLEIGFTEEEMPTLKGVIMKGAGCAACNGTGYKGRIGVYEIMEVTENIKKAITSNVPEAMLRKIAIKEGMITLRRDALNKVKEGVTTIEQAVENTIVIKESLPAYLLNPDELVFEDGDVIISEGNTDKNFYQLIQGSLVITKSDTVVGMITQPGDYFGEMSALLDQPRSATILSRGKSIVKIFPGDKLKESIENYNEIALKIINSIITRLQGADKRLSAMGQKVLQNDE